MFFYSALAFCMAISSRHFFKILFIVFVILPLVYPRSLYFSPIAGSFLLYEFLAGAVLAGAWVHPRTTHVIEKYRGLMLSLAVVLILAGIKMLTSLGAKLPIAVAIVVSALLYEHYLRRDSLLVKQLVKLGDESYSTYLSHCIVIGIAVHYTGKNLGQMAQISILLAITCTVYLMSAASFRWLEKSTCLESLRCATVRIFTRDGQESTGMARSSADKTTTPGASE
jgi:peptidoglycan/LPS O-acetylase OafA/YrhL